MVSPTYLLVALAGPQEAPALANNAKEQQQVVLSLGVLVFGLCLSVAEVYMTKQGEGWDPQRSTQLLGITVIIVAGMFLITAGYSENQIASMMGLLGAIAGYLLGRTEGGGPGSPGGPRPPGE